MSKITIVTGGLGFAGSHLVAYLRREGVFGTIICVDNLSSPVISPSEASKIWPDVKIIIDDAGRFISKCGWNGHDAIKVFHLASIAGPLRVARASGSVLFDMVKLTQQVLEYVIRNRARLIYVSSSEVYGGGVLGACSNKMPCKVLTPYSKRTEYALGKLASDVMVSSAVRAAKLDAAIVRPFNLAGPMQGISGGFVIPRFVEQARNEMPLTVYGDGCQQRAFTHVSDFVRRVAEISMDNEQNGIYDVGNPFNLISIVDLARRIKLITKSSSEIKNVDPKLIHGPDFEDASSKWPELSSVETARWRRAHNIDQIVSDAIRAVINRDEYINRHLV